MLINSIQRDTAQCGNLRANWIWPKGRSETVNFHALCRKSFQCAESFDRALLRISAFTQYALYINGRYVGSGPEFSDPKLPRFDSHDVTNCLTRGSENVIFVVCHNFGLGVHWQHRAAAGLLLQLDVEEAGSVRTVAATDETWRVREDCSKARNAPRQFWSAGFMECADLTRWDRGALLPGYDDSAWEIPEVLGLGGDRPGILALRPREISPLFQRMVKPVSGERGEFALPAVHCIGFDSILPLDSAGLVEASCVLFAECAMDVTLAFECDDAFAVMLDGAKVAAQSYDEAFARTRVWRGYDEYEQTHYGIGTGEVRACLKLTPGENCLTVVVDQSVSGWGFMLVIVDAVNETILDIPFGASTASGPDRHWVISGPWPSSGMSDSLESLTDLNAPLNALPVCPFERYEHGITDFAMLTARETRSNPWPIPSGERFMLRQGEWAIVDFGTVLAGHPMFAFSAADSDGAVIDIGYSYTIGSDRKLRFITGCRVKYCDRVKAGAESGTWEPFERRALRYVHISCRSGELNVESAAIRSIGYPVTRVAEFHCSDPALNNIHEVGLHTLEILMQYSYQDCMRRECGTLNTSSFNYASRAALLAFGDTGLARKNLLQAIETQDSSGWFDSHGISGANSDEPTECLWMVVWLRDHYAHSGDGDLVSSMFPAIEDNLRFWAKGVDKSYLLAGRNRPIAWQGQGIYIDDVTTGGAYAGRDFPGELAGLNILWYAALMAAAELATVAGRSDRNDFYARRARRVRKSVQDRFWDGASKCLVDWADGDQKASSHHPIFQIAAAYFGAVEPDEILNLVEFLTGKLGLPSVDYPNYPLQTFGFYFYFADILFRHGQDTLAVELLRRVHGSWVAKGGTAFGEMISLPDLAASDGLPESDIHAYGMSAHVHLYTHILGAQPLEPGFRAVRIAPKPGDLTHAAGKIWTPQGVISIEWSIRDHEMHIDVIAPSVCRVEVTPPERYFGSCRACVNGDTLRTV